MRLLKQTCWIAILLATIALRAQTAVCTWTGSWDKTPASATDEIIITSGGNLNWDNTTLPSTVASWHQQASYTGTVIVHTVYGNAGFTNFTVAGDTVIAGGTLAHLPNTTNENNRLFMTITGNLTIEDGAAIGHESLGYISSHGPGGVTNNDCGATHGGRGGGGGPTNVYGSIFAPVNLGSGGRAGSTGGGSIRLIVHGVLTNNGFITASARSGSYGGAGGSVYITAGKLAGSTNGVIKANGTPNGSSYWGGGGGRVAVILTDTDADFTNYAGEVQAYGGWVGSRSGAAGTVYLETPDHGIGHGILIIDNSGGYDLSSREVYTLMPPGINLSVFDHIVITNNGILAVSSGSMLDFGNVTIYGHSRTKAHIVIVSEDAVVFPDPFIIGSYTLNLNSVRHVSGDWIVGASGRLSHSTGMELNLAIDGNLTVMAGGEINVDQRGSSGPGDDSTAGYGGLGGNPDGMGVTYGSILAPANSGSSATALGGGVIILTVTGALTNNGTITSIGGRCASGGTINITARTLVGSESALIRANGGGGDNGFSGGGGRIAVALTEKNADFSKYQGAITCFGGHSHKNRKGAAGTIFTITTCNPPDWGTVLVDNNNYLNEENTNIVTSLPAFPESTEYIRRTAWISQNMGKIGMITNAVIHELTLQNNGSLELAGHTLSLEKLIINDMLYKPGIYTADELGESVTDQSGGDGCVVVRGTGSVIQIK